MSSKDCTNGATHEIDSAVEPQTWRAFRSYTITSTISTNGSCITTTSQPTLETPFLVINPLTVNASGFSSIALSSFYSFLGRKDCPHPQPTDIIQIQNMPSLVSGTAAFPADSRLPSVVSPTKTLFSTPSTVPLSHASGLDRDAKITLGVVFSVSVSAILLLGLYGLRIHLKRMKKTAVKYIQTPPPLASPPYFQHKAESEAEGKAQYELEAEERRYETAGNALLEMPSILDSGMLREQTQELSGPEFSVELQAEPPGEYVGHIT